MPLLLDFPKSGFPDRGCCSWAWSDLNEACKPSLQTRFGSCYLGIWLACGTCRLLFNANIVGQTPRLGVYTSPTQARSLGRLSQGRGLQGIGRRGYSMRPTWPLTGRRPTAGSGGARAARWLRVPGVHMHPRSPGTARRPAGGRATLGSPCSTAL